jgi:DNA-binding Xre family transcriptional regulator
MLVFNLSRALKPRGVEKHYKFLLEQGFVPSSAHGFLRGAAIQIKFEQLERLCLALNCTPNDLFEW